MGTKKEILSPLEQEADGIVEINLDRKRLSKKNRKFVRDIIADCLFEDPETEKTERFFLFAMAELGKKKLGA